ncbi:MAG: hydroxyacid dehydrogenase [Saprospirales bacterium]|nr:hydroxyacid dehydrogenase [Saprospirales bacterium]
MRILFLNQSHPVLQARLQALGFFCEEDLTSSETELESLIAGYTGIVLRSRISIGRKLIDRAENLRFIAREGVGLEHIDTEYAESKGIVVLTSPEGSRDTVGEHALGLLLSLLNNLSRADRQVRQGQWIRESNRGVEIKGKTVGILGYGNMGSAFARKLQGFEARVIAYDKYKSAYGDAYAEAVSLEQLWEESDLLSIHIPYMPSNHYFIDGAFLDRFHKPIYLVNTARGLVLNTADLVSRLQTGKVLGAALDVLEYEETSFEQVSTGDIPAPMQYLLQADNVVLSPHIAGWSFESKKGHAEVLANKIEQLIFTFGNGVS